MIPKIYIFVYGKYVARDRDMHFITSYPNPNPPARGATCLTTNGALETELWQNIRNISFRGNVVIIPHLSRGLNQRWQPHTVLASFRPVACWKDIYLRPIKKPPKP